MPSNKHAMVTEKTKQKKSDETGNVRPINVCKSIRFFAIFAKRLCIKKTARVDVIATNGTVTNKDGNAATKVETQHKVNKKNKEMKKAKGNAIDSISWSATGASEIGETTWEMGRLKGVSALISPDLLHTLASMGHGDEIGT